MSSTAEAAQGHTSIAPLDLLRRGAAAGAPPAAVLLVQFVVFPVPLGVWLQGAVLGLLNALVVLGFVLIYRANRVVNFAQASIGTLPATIAGGLVLYGAPDTGVAVAMAAVAAIVVGAAALTVGRLGALRSGATALAVASLCLAGLLLVDDVRWKEGLVVGLVVAVLSGLAIDTFAISRFRTAPRLVVTVATIGLAQVFAVLSLLAPRLWGAVLLVDPQGQRTGFEVPWDADFTVGTTVFSSAEIVAVVASVVLIGLVTSGLRWSHYGMAVRAAADRSDRASMLGIPVPRLEAGVWVVAAILAFVGSYLQAGILGLELTAGLGLRVTVAALGAMALGGFRSLPTMLSSAVAIGVLTQATGPAGGQSLTFTDAVLAAVVIVALLVRRRSSRRADRHEQSNWQAAAEPRGLPFELAGVAALRVIKILAVVSFVALAALVPLLTGESAILRASTVIALVVITGSVVVLTGWTGEVTLGQMSFAATGAAVAAFVTAEWRFDLSLALLAGGLTAAVAAVVVGLPSLRWRGIFLAVTTLSFAMASINYLLNPTVATWIPTADIARRPLFGVIDLASRTAMYEVALVTAVACFAAVASVRRSRVGRVLRAVRDNPASSQAFGVRVPVARLCAFALSGFLAGVGGVLLFAVNERYEVGVFSATESLNVFISSVVGGVGSLVGAVLGAVVLDGSRTFFSGPAALLPSAVGVLVVLLLLPGGLADLGYRLRNRLLRAWADRKSLVVPSLVADRRIPDPLAHEPHGEVETEAAAVPAGGGGVGGPDVARGWLSVRGLDVAYDRVQVLFDVDLDIAEGQITALLGTNGAGKSTLLRAIGGVAPVTRGSVLLADVDLASLRPEQVPTLGIAQMPGGHGVFGSLTVNENLQMAVWLFRGDRDDAATRITEARARFPVLEARRTDQAADLSGGQQQQLALAMALAARPKLLLVDELSLGLAPAVVEDLLVELRALRDQGTTIVVVEQSVNLALAIADHAYFMEKGEIRYSGPAAALLEQPELVRSVYLRGARHALAPDGPSPIAAGADGVDEAASEQTATGAQGTALPSRDGRGSALAVSGLSVRFGGITAVDDVDLAVAPGEVVGLIGPNGAGKTTLFDLISGFTGAETGQVTVAGTDITGLAPSARARLGLGRSFQDARLFGGLTVTETIAVALERWIEGDDLVSAAFGLPGGRAAERLVRERVDELIETFGLGAFRSKLIAELSTGSRRMVDLACVVAHQPSVVLLDEPSSGIAQREAEALGPILLGFRERLGASLLVIEHDISLISSVADRLVALDRGRVVTAGSPAEVLGHPEVVASYLGSSTETRERSGQRTEARP